MSAKRRAPKKPATKKKEAPVVIEAAPLGEVATQDDLLEKCRTRWQHGKWADLAALSEGDIQHAGSREKVAMLVAVGHAQLGNLQQARNFVKLAADWGCGKDIIARVLIGSVHNSLGSAFSGLGQTENADQHYIKSIGTVEPKADVELLAWARKLRECLRLQLREESALLLGADSVMQERLMLERDSSRDVVKALQDLRDLVERGQSFATPQISSGFDVEKLEQNPRFSRKSFEAYGRKTSASRLVEIKSLPRSGLHYTKAVFKQVFDDDFSFCEWYNEPGCCKRMPCSLIKSQGADRFGVRMVKSHDFDLKDPIFPVQNHMQRLVLVREPLSLLTSWWGLWLLDYNRDLLFDHGIGIQKINYRHERGVVKQAHEIVEVHGQMPKSSELVSWLAQKSVYIVNFAKKWEQDSTAIFVRYEDLPQQLSKVLSQWQEAMPKDMQQRASDFIRNSRSTFEVRSTPWDGRSEIATEYLRQHKAHFQAAATKILKQDRTGLLPREI